MEFQIVFGEKIVKKKKFNMSFQAIAISWKLRIRLSMHFAHLLIFYACLTHEYIYRDVNFFIFIFMN